MEPILIGQRLIATDTPPLIIAEISGNHQGSLTKALAMVDAAADAGVDAIKLQTYTADTMTLNIHENEFFIHDPNSLWYGQSLYQLYQQASTPWEWHEPIFTRAKERNILAFSTPFDTTAVNFLETLNVPAYKISSFENIDLPLIQAVAATGKPVIISTGMATLAELDEAVTTARTSGCQHLILLKCTSSYPAEPTDAHLATLPHLQDLFQCYVGLSDHTLGIGVPAAATALGAKVIEKHFVLSRQSNAIDQAFSLEPQEFSELVEQTKRAWQALGHIHYGPTPREIANRSHRRSLYITEDLKAGDRLTHDNLRAIRPAYGLAPKYLEQLLEKPVKQDVRKGTPMHWDLV